MRSTFPGHFRPTQEQFKALWDGGIFVIDANVLLNLYRYSPETRRELERALESVKQRLFVPHQAAKELLKNRLTVTAGQADEYTKAIKTITELTTVLSNKKKHPFIPDVDLSNFSDQVDMLVAKLEEQKAALLDRLTNDEILDFIQALTESRIGAPFDEATLGSIAADGDKRYQNEIPPGYKDGKKDNSGDPYRKFGDLILWKQLISKAKSEAKPVIFITDDKKEDWWLEQSGRTIGPRSELRDEFLSEVGQNFWMYTVDKFIEETARTSHTKVSDKVIEEIIEVRQEVSTNQNDRLAELANFAAMSTAANKINRLSDLANFTAMTAAADKFNRLGDPANFATMTTAADQINRLGGIANFAAMTTAADQINRLGGIANFTAMTTAADQINRLGGIANFTAMTTAADRIKPDSLYYGSGITTGDMSSDTDKPDSPD